MGNDTKRKGAVFCNRTLNLHGIKAIGYDMDYTLVHYHTEEWERRVYELVRERLVSLKWPVDDLCFDPALAERGLVIDRELGNIVKANRFGYVKRASHGTRMLRFDELKKVYGRTVVDLSERRWVFLNTLFSIAEACLYAQLVDRMDAGDLPDVPTYDRLARVIRDRVDETHMEGQLKGDVRANPEQFVDLDPDVPRALLEQKLAGKKLLLITNSEWDYTKFALDYAFDPFLPEGMTWRELFTVTIVAARKPAFFMARQPILEVVSDEGLLRPWNGPIEPGRIYHGGSADHVEEALGLSGEDILYVGDHVFGDVSISKSLHRWRTALVLRELEDELRGVEAFRPQQRELDELMARKATLEERRDAARVQQLRAKHGLAPLDTDPSDAIDGDAVRRELAELDRRIAPLAAASSQLGSERWGSLMRTGNDKSHLARQLERHADIYLSRVGELLYVSPFAYLRSPRGSLPHDPGAVC